MHILSQLRLHITARRPSNTPGSCFIARVVKCLLLVADNFDGFPSFVDTIKITTLPTINSETLLSVNFTPNARTTLAHTATAGQICHNCR